MPMQEGFVQCIYCKKKTAEEDTNSFGECVDCYGRTMDKIRGGQPVFPPTPKKKKRTTFRPNKKRVAIAFGSGPPKEAVEAR